MNYKIIAKDGRAKRAEVSTVHGTIQTPVFMNVGTVGAIKGAVSTDDLKEIRTQVELSNTYHLHVRTGDKLIREFGGLHKFMNWDRPILTDSGGFQVFSLTGLRKIKEEGVYFQSHIDGHRIFMGPEESMQIQSNLGSTIAMALDECPPHPATREYMQNSVDRTTRWLERCKVEMARLNSLPETINQEQLLFGINQGGTYEDIRIEHAKTISAMDLDGYALGGLAVGESHEEMYRILGVSERRPISWRRWTGAWISSTVSIRPETAAMAMSIPIRANGTYLIPSMSWITSPSKRAAGVRPAVPTAELISGIC